MLSRYFRWLLALIIGLAISRTGVAQEEPPASERPADREATYLDLRRSKDRLTQQTADRYFNLIKLQEWSDSQGKFKTMAKYVAHDPGLKWVKLEVVKGQQRSVKEVPVDRLSKTCQSRVRQIALIQPKLDELAAAAPANGEAGGSPEGERGRPMLDDRGREPRPRRGPEEEEDEDAPQAEPDDDADKFSSRVRAEADPSAAEEDPLGFGEFPAGPPVGGGGPPGALVVVGGPPGVGVFAPPPNPITTRPDVDRKQWATDYAAFRANFTVGTDAQCKPQIDWGELRELQAMSQAAANLGSGNGAASREQPAGPREVVEVEWIAPFQGLRPTGGAEMLALGFAELPAPLEIHVRLDDQDGPPVLDEWSKFSAGEPVKFKGRLEMSSPTTIVVYVREPEPPSSAPPAAVRK